VKYEKTVDHQRPRNIQIKGIGKVIAYWQWS